MEAPSTTPATAKQACAAPPITVVLADDHALVRRDLRRLLERDGDVEVVAETGNLLTAMRHVVGHVPHVVVLDLSMDDGSGIQMIRRVRTRAPETEVVVVTAQDSPFFVRQALDAGAVGYVVKVDAAADLPRAVRRAATGRRYLSPRLSGSMSALDDVETDGGLSPREAEVLRLIALGYTNAEIAGRLHLSQRTVETHRLRMQRKLGLQRRWQLVGYALAHHLIGS